MYSWTPLGSNTVFVMDKVWFAQESSNRTSLRFRLGRPFFSVTPLPHVSLSPQVKHSQAPHQGLSRPGTVNYHLVHKLANPLLHWKNLQYTGSKVRGYQDTHPSPLPLTKGNSRLGHSPAVFRRLVPEPKSCVEVSPTISSHYLSTSHTSSGSFPTREVGKERPAGGKHTGVWTHVPSSGCTRPGPMG